MLYHLTLKLTRKEPIRKRLSPQARLKPKKYRANSPEETLVAQFLLSWCLPTELVFGQREFQKRRGL